LSLVTNIWGLIALASVIWVIYDVLTRNRSLSDIVNYPSLKPSPNGSGF